MKNISKYEGRPIQKMVDEINRVFKYGFNTVESKKILDDESGKPLSYQAQKIIFYICDLSDSSLNTEILLDIYYDDKTRISDKKSAILLSLKYMKELYKLGTQDFKYVSENINMLSDIKSLSKLDQIDIVMRFYKYLGDDNKSLEYLDFINLPSMDFFSDITNIVEYINYKYEEQQPHLDLSNIDQEQMDELYNDLKSDMSLYFHNDSGNIKIYMQYLRNNITIRDCVDNVNNLYIADSENLNQQYNTERKYFILVNLAKYFLDYNSFNEYLKVRFSEECTKNNADLFIGSYEYMYCKNVIKGIFDIQESDSKKFEILIDVLHDVQLVQAVCNQYKPLRSSVIECLRSLIKNKEFDLINDLYLLPIDPEDLDNYFNLSKDNDSDILVEAFEKEGYCIGNHLNYISYNNDIFCQCDIN